MIKIDIATCKMPFCLSLSFGESKSIVTCIFCPLAYAAPKIPIQIKVNRDSSSVTELGEFKTYLVKICHRTLKSMVAISRMSNDPKALSSMFFNFIYCMALILFTVSLSCGSFSYSLYISSTFALNNALSGSMISTPASFIPSRASSSDAFHSFF